VIEDYAAEQLDARHHLAHKFDAIRVHREDALEHQPAITRIAGLDRDVDLVEGPVEEARRRMEMHVDDAVDEPPVRLGNG